MENVDFSKIKKVGNAIYEMERHGSMNVPALIIGTEPVLEVLKKDKTLMQLKNMASLPGIVKNAVLMPDGHEGYGFPIGGVAAFDAEEGIVSPGGVGYDINCGVRMIKTGLYFDDIKNKAKELSELLFKTIPTGVGSEGKIKLSHDKLDELCELGIDWAIENSYAEKKDREKIEENGKMQDSDAKKVSPTAKARGKSQLGTLGAGNHFLEVQKVENVFDEKTADGFGLDKNQIVIMIHCGSRGLGHQVASDYIKEFLAVGQREKYFLPDPELAYLYLKNEKSENYLKAMRCAVNFAFVNRQVITKWVMECFGKTLGSKTEEEMELVYDVSHNIAKFEMHTIDNKRKKLLVHRKGATRAFPGSREELPAIYRKTGQPVLIPGSMGTSSYILAGEEKGLEISFGSSCHGAGRAMSRSSAMNKWKGEEIIKSLEGQGILVKTKSAKGSAEEAPLAYKDVDLVAKSVELAGISKIVARTKPIIVIKG